jgi:hypothetical protein
VRHDRQSVSEDDPPQYVLECTVSSVDRRMQLKLVINELFDVDYWDIHPRLQMKYYWNLDRILNCTNEKFLFIIDFIEKMINDASFFYNC